MFILQETTGKQESFCVLRGGVQLLQKVEQTPAIEQKSVFEDTTQCGGSILNVSIPSG
jgi:hypothetical protein